MKTAYKLSIFFTTIITCIVAIVIIIGLGKPSTTSTKKQSAPYIYEFYPKFCDLKSCKNEHALCVYRPFKLNCADEKPGTCTSKITQEQKRVILHTFNFQRSSIVASADMMILRWHQDLEQLSQHYVMLRFNETEGCPRTEDDIEYGQILKIWQVENYEAQDITEQMKDKIKSLYLEYYDFYHSLMSPEQLNSWDGENKEAIQLIWAKTSYVGCSFVKEVRDVTTLRMVCNFLPPPVVGQKIFEFDDTRQGKCPNGSNKGKNYPELCIPNNVSEESEIPLPWYNRVRVFKNGMIMYPDYTYVFPSGSVAPKLTTSLLIFVILFQCFFS